MNTQREHIIVCGDAKVGNEYRSKKMYHIHKFSCDPHHGNHNVTIDLPHFRRIVGCHFPERIKDLLEIASYIYAADRMIDRGASDALEYQRWSRKFNFIIKVRDYSFWRKPEVQKALSEALTFVSGDYSFIFTFQSGGKDTGQTVLTDAEGFTFEKKPNAKICLFSGGLDSLSGALKLLSEGNDLILISHRSNNPGVSNIQEGIKNRIAADYPGRVQFFPFHCNLTGARAVEETQRTRIFLYTSIAFSLMSLSSDNTIHVFENGITSINFSKRQDAMNARASRTTHPQTLGLLQNFYALVADGAVTIAHPFLMSTKSDVLEVIKTNGKESYINSTLTCTKTFQKFKNNSNASHCGRCSQCVDRRLAAYATGLEEFDALYDTDIAKDEIDDPEGFTHLHDYLFKVFQFKECNERNFPVEYYDELVDILPFINGKNNQDKTQYVFNLVKSHTDRITTALHRIRATEDLTKPQKTNSIFQILESREYLKGPVELVAERIGVKLATQIPLAFQTQKPKSEKVLNDYIQSFISSSGEGYSREFPVIRFATAKTIPDHEVNGLYIEAKYPRNKKSQSALTDELAADITKYGKTFKMFVIYDPERIIVDDSVFTKFFQSFNNIRIQIIR